MQSLKFTILLVLLAILTFQPLPIRAQERPLYPINRYVRNEGLFDDFIVQFLIPCNSNFRIVASGNKEAGVLSRSTVTASMEGSRKRVTVTTGFRARKLNNYHGNINQWANSLNLYYLGCPR